MKGQHMVNIFLPGISNLKIEEKYSIPALDVSSVNITGTTYLSKLRTY